MTGKRPAAPWDQFTFVVLAQTQVGAGWRCLDIGAGAQSVSAWLLERVGPTGQVVSADARVVRHFNVPTLRPDGFDLVHVRLLFGQVPQASAVIAKLRAALRPGGWLVVEDFDIRRRWLLSLLRDAGLADVRAAGPVPFADDVPMLVAALGRARAPQRR